MNRLLCNIFLCLAVLLVAHGILLANYLHNLGQDFIHAKVIWAEVALASFLVVAGLRFSLSGKFKIFSVLLVCLLMELFFQAAALLGVLPLVTTKITAPFARVYWAAEGRGNSIRNRYGWYYSAFNLKAPHRIAYIGDSQVEVVEVLPTRNQAADLEKLLRARSPDWAVLGLGTHGTCPAFSIDVLDYAARHFQPQEAVVVVSLGSDFNDASPKLNGLPPSAYVYYDLDAEGKLVINPGSVPVRDRFKLIMELNYRSVLANLPIIIFSHCMTIQVVDSLRDYFKQRHQQAALATRDSAPQGKEAEEFHELGFNPAPCAINPDAETIRATAVLLAQLRECKAVCDHYGMALRLVTVPSFPAVFFQSQHGRDWSLKIGDYDYLKPEREITDWAGTNGIPLLALGRYIQDHKLEVEEVRSLYFSNGMGHLSEKGHQFCAQAVFDAFYK